MKLREFIKKVDGDQMVSIGTKNGSGFVYIGYAKDFLKEEQKVNENELIKLEALYNNAMNDYKVDIRKHRPASINRKLMEKYKCRVDSYVRLSVREVKDVYASYNRQKVIILVDGDEVGSYWTIREYKRLTEEEAYKDWIRSRYELDEHGNAVLTTIDLDENYQEIRCAVVKAMSKRYRSKYELCLMYPNKQEYKDQLKIVEDWFLGDGFAVYGGGLDGDGVIRMMRDIVDKKVHRR